MAGPRWSAGRAACGRRPAAGRRRPCRAVRAAGPGRSIRPAGRRTRCAHCRSRPGMAGGDGGGSTTGSGSGWATSARASASSPRARRAGPRAGRWNSARQVTSSTSEARRRKPVAACTGPVGLRRGRKQRWPCRLRRRPVPTRRIRVAGPVAGQRGVQQPGQVPRVGELRVVGGRRAVRPSGLARPGRRRCRARDFHAAARGPVQAGRVQPQVRQADVVRAAIAAPPPRSARPRAADRAGPRRACRAAIRRHPLQHHVGELFGVLHVEHLGEARIVEPARGPGRGDGLGTGGTGREREHGDGTGEGLVRGLPVRPAGARLPGQRDGTVPPAGFLVPTCMCS